MIKISIEKQEPIDLDVDASRLVAKLNLATAEHFRRSNLAGRTPDGRALPTNSKGQPLGRGSGTIANYWEIGGVEGDKLAATAANGPYMEGGYRFVVLRLEDEGASMVSMGGQTDALIDGIVSAEADRMVGL